MKLADPMKSLSLDEIKAALAGGKLVVYSLARPASPDKPVERSGVLVTFTFAAPAFAAASGAEDGTVQPLFAENPVVATGVGTPGFARAFTADGSTVVADFSVGAGDTDIKFKEISTTPKYPVTLTQLKIQLPSQ